MLNQANPKFVPREWMLVHAYERAELGDYVPLLELTELFTRPYDEQLGDMTERFYRKAPPETYQGHGRAGQTRMS